MVDNGSKKIISGNNGPLFQKNVIKMKIDQNNINTSNQETSYSKSKPIIGSNKLISDPLNNVPLEQLNRQHFDAMNNLHS